MGAGQLHPSGEGRQNQPGTGLTTKDTKNTKTQEDWKSVRLKPPLEGSLEANFCSTVSGYRNGQPISRLLPVRLHVDTNELETASCRERSRPAPTGDGASYHVRHLLYGRGAAFTVEPEKKVVGRGESMGHPPRPYAAIPTSQSRSTRTEGMSRTASSPVIPVIAGPGYRTEAR